MVQERIQGTSWMAVAVVQMRSTALIATVDTERSRWVGEF